MGSMGMGKMSKVSKVTFNSTLHEKNGSFYLSIPKKVVVENEFEAEQRFALVLIPLVPAGQTTLNPEQSEEK